MTPFLNIVLLTCGFVGALAAFGGETWRKTDEPLLKRVTNRGWLSVSCLVLTLIVGVLKEVRSNISAHEESIKRANVEQQLQTTTRHLETANGTIVEMKKQVALIPRLVYSIGQELKPYEPKILEQKLFGGDQIRYYLKCKQIYLIVGNKEYHLNPSEREIIIEGPERVPMTAILQNRSDKGCGSKMNILSIEVTKP
jgi:hypothetical protein